MPDVGPDEFPTDRDRQMIEANFLGAVAWLNGRLVHRNLAVRGYVPRSDRVPIRLQRGPNVLLVKVTQGTGPWLFGARLTDPTGRPLKGVRTTVERPGAG